MAYRSAITKSLRNISRFTRRGVFRYNVLRVDTSNKMLFASKVGTSDSLDFVAL